MSRVVISSMIDMTRFFRQVPGLKSLSSLSPLVGIDNLYRAEAGKCGMCGGRGGMNTLMKYRPVFENAMGTLSQDDRAKMKALLNATEICYYVRNEKSALTLRCF